MEGKLAAAASSEVVPQRGGQHPQSLKNAAGPLRNSAVGRRTSTTSTRGRSSRSGDATAYRCTRSTTVEGPGRRQTPAGRSLRNPSDSLSVTRGELVAMCLTAVTRAAYLALVPCRTENRQPTSFDSAARGRRLRTK